MHTVTGITGEDWAPDTEYLHSGPFPVVSQAQERALALRVCTEAPTPGVFKKVQFPPQRGILFSQLLGEIKLVSFSNRSKVSLAPFPLLLLRLHNFQSSVYARAGSLSPHHLHVLPRHKKRRNQHEDMEPQGNVLGHLVLVSRTKGLLA